MVDRFCNYLTGRIRVKMPEIDDERAEIIQYGLQLLIGELPKFFIMLGIAWILGVVKLTIICFFIMLPYRMSSGGFHLKTHIGCIIGTSLMYIGNAYLSQFFHIDIIGKIIISIALWIISIIMIFKYAPADTEDVPIISKSERRKKRVSSYVVVTIMLVIGCFINIDILSNMIIIGVLLQTFSISRFAYNITNNKYGHEVYLENEDLNAN